ncbi:MAG: hypothetical protein LBD76_02010 [Prevotellaceae bacterium]|jgi:hypothetical protein|nr:hypothetical protein [Prevotellaceae bacterium]
MSKQKKNKQSNQLSPENYIRQRARNLPIYKCYVFGKWEETKKTIICVVRKHASEKLTFGIYIVDLMCLGIKESVYAYNVPEEELHLMLKNLEKKSFRYREISYNLAHNILYAAIEYAEEYGFRPAPSFIRVTQFLLEEDNEDIPYITIHCGDENGNPIYIHSKDETSAEKTRILARLEATAGHGNYNYIDLTDEDEEDEEDDDDDDDEEYEDEDDDDEEYDEEYDAFKDSLHSLDEEEIKERFIDMLSEVEKFSTTIPTTSQHATMSAILSVILEKVINVDKVVNYFEKIKTYFNINVVDIFNMPNSFFQGLPQYSHEKLIKLYDDFLDGIKADETEQTLKKLQEEAGDTPFVKYLELQHSDYSNNEYVKKLDQYSKEYPDYLMFKILRYSNSPNLFKQFKTLLIEADEPVTVIEFSEFVYQYAKEYVFNSNFDIEELIAYEAMLKIMHTEEISFYEAEFTVTLAKIYWVKKYYGIK